MQYVLQKYPNDFELYRVYAECLKERGGLKTAQKVLEKIEEMERLVKSK